MGKRNYLLVFVIMISLFFFAGSAGANPKNGVWYKTSEPGSGIYIDIQGEHLAVGWFAYDQNTGAPVWFMSDGAMSDPNSYSGDMWEFTNGQYIGGPYAQPMQSTIGELSITFHSDTSATISCPMAAIEIEHYFNFLPLSESVLGTYTLKKLTISYEDGTILRTEDGTISATGTMVIAQDSLTQTVTVNGTTRSETGDYSYEYTLENSAGLVNFSREGETYIFLFSLSGYDLITMATIDTSDGYTEWDMWTKISDKTTMSIVDVNQETGSKPCLGGIAGSIAIK